VYGQIRAAPHLFERRRAPPRLWLPVRVGTRRLQSALYCGEDFRRGGSSNRRIQPQILGNPVMAATSLTDRITLTDRIARPAPSASEAMSTQSSPSRRRLPIGPILYGLPLLVVLGLQLWQILGLNPYGLDIFNLQNCSPTSSTCFDTGWQPVSSKTSSIYYYKHKLAATPRFIAAWFSPTADGSHAYSLSTAFSSPNVGNPVTIEVRPDVVLVHTWSGVPIHGVYNGGNEKWTTFAEGYYRIIAIK
jgi:hypothetical protein